MCIKTASWVLIKTSVSNALHQAFDVTLRHLGNVVFPDHREDVQLEGSLDFLLRPLACFLAQYSSKYFSATALTVEALRSTGAAFLTTAGSMPRLISARFSAALS